MAKTNLNDQDNREKGKLRRDRIYIYRGFEFRTCREPENTETGERFYLNYRDGNGDSARELDCSTFRNMGEAVEYIDGLTEMLKRRGKR